MPLIVRRDTSSEVMVRNDLRWLQSIEPWCFRSTNTTTTTTTMGSYFCAPPPTHTDTTSSGSKQERARTIKNLFWEDDVDALNYLQELVETGRLNYDWYACVLDECRDGAISTEKLRVHTWLADCYS